MATQSRTGIVAALHIILALLCFSGICTAQYANDELQLQVCGQELQQFAFGSDSLIRTTNNLCATNVNNLRVQLNACNSSLLNQKWQLSNISGQLSNNRISQGLYCWTSQSAQPNLVYPTASIKLFLCPSLPTWNSTFTGLGSTIVANFTSPNTSVSTSGLCVGSFHMYTGLLTPGFVNFGKLRNGDWWTARTDMLDAASYRLYVWNWWGPTLTPSLQLYSFVSPSGECEESLSFARQQGSPAGTVVASNNFYVRGSSPQKYELALGVPAPAEKVCMGVYCFTSSGCTVEIRFDMWPNRSEPMVGPRIHWLPASTGTSPSQQSPGMTSGEIAGAIFGSLFGVAALCGCIGLTLANYQQAEEPPDGIGPAHPAAPLDAPAATDPLHVRAAPDGLHAARQSALYYYRSNPHSGSSGVLRTSTTATSAERECSVCLSNEKDTLLGCGHCFCSPCAYRVSECPACRAAVSRRVQVQLYSPPSTSSTARKPGSWRSAFPMAPPGITRQSSVRLCTLCEKRKTDTALGCGHVFCEACVYGDKGVGTLSACPTCHVRVTTRIKLFH